jgi:uncharacterized protein (DUF433 family)
LVPAGERAEFVRQLLERALHQRERTEAASAIATPEGEKLTGSPGLQVVRDPDRCGGDPTLAGTRTAVHDIVSYVDLYGGDLERVREEALPHLSIEQIRAALVWYDEIRHEIDGILARRREYYERGLAETQAAR